MTEEMKARTIGVEIEFTGITRNAVASCLKKYFSSESIHVGGHYDKYTVTDEKGRKWTVMFDSSIMSEKKNSNGDIEYLSGNSNAGNIRKCELVTPILTWEDIQTLQEIVKKVERAGGFVNSSCGIHIHIGGECFSPGKLKDLVNLMASKEDLIYRALGVLPARMNYCKKTNKSFLNKLNEEKPKDILELAKIWYNSDNPESNMQYHYDSTRYTHTNLHAFFTKGTVEFRMFNSTLNPVLITSYIQFCLAVVARAITSNREISYKQTIIENEKYQMRNWLRQLGLNGEEYRECRHTFLNKLTGDLVNKKVS